MVLTYTTAQTDEEIEQILALQQANLPQNISAEEMAQQGFVTVQHTFELLKRMNEIGAHVIAKDGDQVVAYALTMTTDFRHDIPILLPMFEMIDAQMWKGKPLSEWKYYIMGQICVGKAYRAQGVFDGLYAQMKKEYADVFDMVITEVSARNQRSLRAHQRVGFEALHTYAAPDGEVWELIYWDFGR